MLQSRKDLLVAVTPSGSNKDFAVLCGDRDSVGCRVHGAILEAVADMGHYIDLSKLVFDIRWMQDDIDDVEKRRKMLDDGHEAMDDIDLSEVSLFDLYDHAFWFDIVRRDEYVNSVIRIIEKRPELLEVIDFDGNHILEIMNTKCIEKGITKLLIFKRYTIRKENYIHKSKSCIIYLAEDRINKSKEYVILKFFNDLKHYKIQLNIHKKFKLDPSKVLDIYSINGKKEIYQDASSDGYLRICPKSTKLYPYCIVYPSATESMEDFIAHGGMVGRSLSEVRQIFLGVINCVLHLHESGLIHGGINPTHIVYHDNKWKLIGYSNFSLNSLFEKDSVDLNSLSEDYYIKVNMPSQYCPPEYFHIDMVTGKVFVKDVSSRHMFGGLEARPSFDIWSLGVLFYTLLCQCDDMAESSSFMDHHSEMPLSLKRELACWNTKSLLLKVAHIRNAEAKSLISQMLHPDPELRGTLASIRTSEFFQNNLKENSQDKSSNGQEGSTSSVKLSLMKHSSRSLESSMSNMALVDRCNSQSSSNLMRVQQELSYAAEAILRLRRIFELLQCDNAHPTAMILLDLPYDDPMNSEELAFKYLERLNKIFSLMDKARPYEDNVDKDLYLHYENEVKKSFQKGVYMYLICQACHEPQRNPSWPIFIDDIPNKIVKVSISFIIFNHEMHNSSCSIRDIVVAFASE